MQGFKYFVKVILIILLSTVVFSVSNAQKYNVAAGIRWGGNLGLSFSERIAKKVTLEQNITSENENYYYALSALVRYHQPLITKRFNWFYGGGVGIVGIKETDKYPESTATSLVLQTGLEYTLGRATFYVALEPYGFLANSHLRFKMDKMFSIKYVILKRKSKWKKKIGNIFKSKKHKKKKNKSGKKSWWKRLFK